MRFITLSFFLAVLTSLSYGQKLTGVVDRTDYRYKNCNRVYKRIVRAIGDGRSAPRLELNSRLNTAARYVPEQHKISLSTKLYEVTQSFGADSTDALAAVVSHELAHFYKDHKLLVDFGFSDVEVLRDMKGISSDSVAFIETEADYFGGFYGYIAGYQTLDILPEVLEKVYDKFELKEKLHGYMPLDKRQELSKQSKEKLDRLIPVFEMGNNMLILGEYEAAADCFAFISRNDFQSREIINNEGVSYALMALEQMPRDEQKYYFPIQFDENSRLLGKKTRGDFGYGQDIEEEVMELLEMAKDKFEEAKKRDPQYYMSYINLACINAILGEYEMADALASRATRIAPSVSVALNALVIQAIAKNEMGETDEAIALLQRAKKGGNGLADINLSVVSGEEFQLPDQGVAKILPVREQVAGIYSEDIEDIDLEDYVEFGFAKNSIHKQMGGSYQDAILLKGTKLFRFVRTDGEYSGKTEKGIALGTHKKKILESYGKPNYAFSSGASTFLRFDQSRIIFEINGNQEVVGWQIYFIN
ncbi:MAG: hypothetical protein MRY83_00620 [Flavobacteriales bacterium]|nr:hypothetical protein [Flavobacteriales bacterium]